MTVHGSPARQADVDLRRLFSHGPRVLRVRWMVATALGEVAGFLAPALVAAVALDLSPAVSFPLLVVAGTIEGLVLGSAQAWVLGRELLGFDRRAWAAATAAGAASAWVLGLLPATLHESWKGWPPAVTIPVAGVLGLSLVCSIGFAQWTVLRRHLARSRTWVPVNAGAWLLGLGVFMGVSTPLWHEGQSTAAVVAVGAVGGLGMAVTVAAVTGLWIARLASPRNGAPVRRTPAGVSEEEWARLGEPTDSFRVFDPVLLQDLPEPVQRWLVHAVAPGTPLLTGLETQWVGRLRLRGTWRAFCSRQRASLPDGFIWSARTRLGGLPVTGFDRFTRGDAEMRWRLARTLRLVRSSGPEVTRSAAARHAAELVAGVPAVALSPDVRWAGVDHARATAHLVVGGEEQSVTVTVDALGRLRRVELDRWGVPPGGRLGRHRFGAVLAEERRFEGYLVPTEVLVGWHIGSDRWDDGTFLRYRVVACTFH